MGAMQLPGVLLCDDSVTGGILIVSAIGLNQMPLSVTRKAGANSHLLWFCFSKRELLRARCDFVCLHYEV